MERLKTSPPQVVMNEGQPLPPRGVKISFTSPNKDNFWSVSLGDGPKAQITGKQKMLIELLMEEDGTKLAGVKEILVRIFPGASDPKKADLYTPEAVRLLIKGTNRNLQGSGLAVENISIKKKKKKSLYALALTNPDPGRDKRY